MKGNVSLGKKFVNLISSSIWVSITNFSKTRGFLFVLRSDLGDSTTSASTTYAKTKKLWLRGGGKSGLS